MRKYKLHSETVDALVNLFRDVTLAQSAADRLGQMAEYNRLYRHMEEIEQELKRRPGDRRRELEILYTHDDPQVRLQAALATLALLPAESREVLQTLSERHEYPAAMDARGILRALEEGTYTPE